MDNYSVKRTVDGVVVPRRSSGILLRETTAHKDQFCNRLGCKGRLSHTKVTQSVCSGKYKSSKALPLNCSNGIEVTGSSSSTKTVTGGNMRKASEKSQRSPRLLKPEAASSETTSRSTREDEKHDSEIGKVSVADPKGISNRKRVFGKKIGTQSTLLGSSDAIASKNKVSNQAQRNNVATTSRYGLRSLKCNSISDVFPSGSSSSSDTKLSKRKDLAKKRSSEGESSSSNLGKKMNGPYSEDTRYPSSNHGVCISDSRRGGSNQSQRSVSGSSTRIRRFPAVTPQSESSDVTELPFTPNRFPAEASSSSARSTPFASPVTSSYSREISISNSLLNLEGLHRHNADGIAEILLALERIEQDEGLTYEQLMALDANVFLGGLGIYDQHREMRLDIDNMSYEDLLVLEEKMGSVSTALSEEAISKNLRTSIFRPKAFGKGNKRGSRGDENDIKCSICQEEYEMEDEVGRLKCEHRYHKACIHEWLRLKNWCPICKAPAAATT